MITADVKLAGIDHDYTKTSPTKSKLTDNKNWNSPKPKGKENRAVLSNKKTDIDSPLPLDKRKTLPSTPSKLPGITDPFKPRNQVEEYNVMYSFLIKGMFKFQLKLKFFV